MTDKKKTRRAVSMPRLHESIEQFCDQHGIGSDQPVGKLLDAIQTAWFEEAKKRN